MVLFDICMVASEEAVFSSASVPGLESEDVEPVPGEMRPKTWIYIDGLREVFPATRCQPTAALDGFTYRGIRR